MFLMDRFFDGAFLTFGLEVIAFAEQDQEDRLDPLIYVFPRMTKCTFHKFGTSGEVEKHDALCLLPLNIVNEKVYIFLWFWFILLAVLSVLVILYRIIIVISPKMRAYLLYIRFRLIRREVINTIVKKSFVGDWFLFYMLGKTSFNKCFKLIWQRIAPQYSDGPLRSHSRSVKLFATIFNTRCHHHFLLEPNFGTGILKIPPKFQGIGHLGPIYTWRRICRRICDEYSTNTQRIIFLRRRRIFLRRVFDGKEFLTLILIFLRKPKK